MCWLIEAKGVGIKPDDNRQEFQGQTCFRRTCHVCWKYALTEKFPSRRRLKFENLSHRSGCATQVIYRVWIDRGIWIFSHQATFVSGRKINYVCRMLGPGKGDNGDIQGCIWIIEGKPHRNLAPIPNVCQNYPLPTFSTDIKYKALFGNLLGLVSNIYIGSLKMVVEIVPEKQMLAISSVNWQNTFIFSICELLCVILKALLIMKLFNSCALSSH